MSSRSKFWMVWNPDGRQPRYEHLTRDSADREAQRLAEENPGQAFYVLKCMTGFACKPSPVDRIKLRDPLPDEIPF